MGDTDIAQEKKSQSISLVQKLKFKKWRLLRGRSD